MKKRFVLPLVALTLTSIGCNQKSTEPTTPTTPETIEQKQAYSVGTRMAKSHKQVVDDIIAVQGDFDIDMYLQGMRDALTDNLQMTEEEMNAISDDYRKAYLANKRAIEEKQKEKARQAAHEFLEANKAKEGVVVTESGLQYKILSTGEGEKPKPEDRVEVFYTGKLVNGDVFDTTSETNKPRQFDINRVVKGWTEGLQLMNEGSKFEFYIPPELGYGMRDRPKIPAGSVLIFEVELLKVIKKAAHKNTKPADK